MRRRPRLRGPLAPTASLLCAALITTIATAAGPAAARATLRWQPCGDRFECARLDVPVDAAAPAGASVSVALIRAPARDPERRVGSLVVNFGGPGDAGTETLPRVIGRFPAVIRDRFDIVSFDPRGTGGTRAIDCVDDTTTDVLAAEDPTPDDLGELERFYTGANAAVDVEKACIDRYGTWLAAVGTRNVARDLERIRVALGGRRLDFLGYSYGTVLGAVYAQEFPDRVRTMVLDGAVNLSATPAEEQAANASGFEGALDRFLQWCDGRARCPFDDGDPRAALTRLRDRFESGLLVPAGDSRAAGVGTFYLALIAALYDRDDGWPALALALTRASRGDGTVLQHLADAYLGRDENGRYDVLQEAIGPIRCADARRPLVDFPEYRATFERLTAEYPFFGALVGSSQTGCDPRLPVPVPGDEVGDVRAAPDAPVLIIGTTGDPATPYEGAIDLATRIRGSRVLTFESAEHAAYGRGDGCIDDAVNRYLLTRRLPPPGTRCRP
jgi:pimeloyl-ACP methyl ester carboxylesterase